MKRIVSIAAVAVFGTLPTTAGDWKHTITPYAWAAGQAGDTGERDTRVGDLIVEYDLSPSDIFERLDGAFLLAYRAEKDQAWGLLFDVVYMNVEDDGEVGSLDVNVENPQLLVSAAFTRRFREGSSWWWHAGIRYVDLETEIRFEGSGLVGLDDTVTVDQSWLDPFVGLSYRRELSPRWSLGVVAEAGGFGVGSDISYQAMADIGIKFSEMFGLRAGYRWLDTDYDDNDFVFDTTSQGFVIGLDFRW